ncbi:MAG: pseudaminic acid synthase [Candidatus Curtissbacteria bacterium]|nr:pseudaminic acid synthase [Candidatus Curtissbacteria bacterium]
MVLFKKKYGNIKKPFIKLGTRSIGSQFPCFVVAEISGNHNQKFEEAVRLIKAAAEAGADAVKIQTYTPDTITLKSNKEWFIVRGKKTPEAWKNETLYDLYKTAYTPWEWHTKLKKVAEELGLIFFSTPFDETAVDFLEKLKVPCYKIASYEVVDIPLIRKVAQTKKPVIMSVGFAALWEIELAVDTLKKYGSGEIALLHCVTQYSASPLLSSMNLRTIGDLQEKFGVVSGFSDNNAGIIAPTIAATMGASIIEKHLITKRSRGGPDSRFSLEPEEFGQMVKKIRRNEGAKGEVKYGPLNSAEEYNMRFRPSIFVSKDIKKGEKFSSRNIKTVRPSNGLPPREWDDIIGSRALYDIELGTPLSWDLIEK